MREYRGDEDGLKQVRETGERSSDGREKKTGDKLLMRGSLNPRYQVASFFFISLLLRNIIKHINLVGRETALRR